MALELGKYVVYGELYNTRHNSVHGWLGMLGMSSMVHFDLTGNCDADLAGKHIRFKIYEEPVAEFVEASVPNFQIRQIGPTGKFTTALQIPVGIDGNPIPSPLAQSDSEAAWKACLYLEWFSQNGRVVVEIIDPVIQVVGEAERDKAEDFFSDILPEEELGCDGLPPGSGLLDESWDEPPLDDDPFDLFGGELQLQLDKKSADVNRSFKSNDEISKDIRELELMDDVIDRGGGVPLQDIVNGTGELPDPGTLTENQAEYALKALLARLAIYGVTLDMCEHYDAMAAYRLLRDKLGPDVHCYRELQGTGWVQHYSTYDFCEICEKEFEKEWAEMDTEINGEDKDTEGMVDG